MRERRVESSASGTARLVQVMKLYIYPGLTYDRPSATLQRFAIRLHIERKRRKRDETNGVRR